MGTWLQYNYKKTTTWIFVPNDYSVEEFVEHYRTTLHQYIDEEGQFSQEEIDREDLIASWREVSIAGETRHIFVPDGFPTVTFIQCYCPDIYYTLLEEQDTVMTE